MSALQLTIIILVIVGVVIFLAYGVILSTPLYECMPYLFDKKAYKIWQECYNDEVVSAKEITYMQDYGVIGTHKEYYFANGKYHAIMFYENDRYIGCDIFKNETTKVVFSSFWKKHSDKLAEKVKNFPITEKTDLTNF